MSALPDLGLEPDETSIKLAMMAYANAGDVYGMEAIFEKYESMGFKSTTATMNIVLKAIVNAPNLDWTYLKTMKETLFNPKNFQPDVNTYVQLLLACEKYDKAGDAILWFNEFINLESKIEITQLIKNIYRQVVEGDDYDKDSPTCPKWETDIKFDIRDDLENSMDYTKLWSKSVKILVDNGEFDDIQKVHPSKVCGVDDDIVVKKSYYSSPSFYEKTISDRISLKQPVSTGIFNSLLQCYVKLEDYESANILFYERSKEYGVHLDHHSISNLLAALVKLGDPMGAEKLLEYALTLEIPIGELQLDHIYFY